MAKLALIIMTVLMSACSGMQANQLRYVCNKKAAHSEGKIAAALQESKSTNRYDRCELSQREVLVKAYNDGFSYYMEYEDNKVGEVNGVAGFGAEINYVCVGTLFHQNYIGKGNNKGKALNLLSSLCKSSDNSVHCSNMHIRCRKINFGNVIN